jgi:hypothetical protein
MFLLAGEVPLNVLIVYRTVFLTVDEANTALLSKELSPYNFLKPMTLTQVAERVGVFGVENIQLTPSGDSLNQTENK